MKIAYLILAHQNLVLLKKLIQKLNHPNASFYIHIDAKCTEKFHITSPNIHLITPSQSINWGGFTLTQAIIKLLHTAHAKSYDRYILLSGNDQPVKSNKFIFDYLSQYPKFDFIDSHPMPKFDKPLTRLNKYYFEYNPRQKNLNTIFKHHLNRLSQLLPYTRKLPSNYRHFQLYAGSTWWALTHTSVSQILDFLHQHPNFINFFKYTFLADEMFFQILHQNILHSPKMPSFTYHNWTFGGPPYPALIQTAHMIDLIKREKKSGHPFLFARKFDLTNLNLINEIK